MYNDPDQAARKASMTLLEQLVSVSLQGERITEAELMTRLRRYNSIQSIPLSASELETISRRLSERLAIDLDLGTVITSRNYQPWLDARKPTIDWGRWLAYKQMLVQQGRAPKVVDKTDELTDKILDLAGDPTLQSPWARRGLVLGDVQSGKTGTYLALFNKAADAGYRLFILLAGNTEALRQQTQARVDEAFIGRDSSSQTARKGTDVTPSKHIGVGLIRRDLAQASGMTTVIRDFRRSSYEATNITIQTDAAHPYVFVVKKNKPVLNALTAWLREQAQTSGGKLSVPVLLLDDESDYASVNTKSETDPTAINQALRDILDMFTRSSYIAFTATPFANIFIDHNVENDLFPRDFVYSLETPTNYIGSAKTFGTLEEVRASGLRYLSDLDELLPLGHRSSALIKALPNSLIQALDTFFLFNAIRDLRGDVDQPRAMLINVSRYKNVQRQVYELVADETSRTKTAIQLHSADVSSQHSVLQRLRDEFNRTYGHSEVSWQDVRVQLPRSVSDIRVSLYNSDTDRKMVLEDGQWDRPSRMVAVGGDVLSRGLTLEGLGVSYFYRRVTAADTLMQMARWFGYRDGYDDLCQIWINQQSADNYRFAADSIEDLRLDLRLMLRQKLTPEDFGLAVKKHPGALLITARNKMKSAQEVRRVIGLAGRRLETTTLLPDHTQNRIDLSWLIGQADLAGTYSPGKGSWHRWHSVDGGLIADFLERYGERAPVLDPIFSGPVLSRWARTATAPKLMRWDLAIAAGRRGSTTVQLGGGRTIPLATRALQSDGEVVRVSGRRRRLAGPTDLAGLLPPQARAMAESDFQAIQPGTNLPERIYYPYLERPALIVYPLGASSTDEDSEPSTAIVVEPDDYLVALKIAIPGDPTKVRNGDGDVTYVINTVAQRNWLAEFSDEAEGEDLDG